MAQWVGRQPEKGKVASSIPSQGTCLVCGPGPQLGAFKRQPIFFSHTGVPPSLPLSLEISKYL